MATGEALANELVALCGAFGVSTDYIGWRGEPVSATPEALWALLTALAPGYGVSLPGEAHTAQLAELAAHLERQRRYGGPAVAVAWEAQGALPMPVRLAVDGDWELEVELESGGREHARGRLGELAATGHHEIDGERWCVRALPLPLRGELGVHRARWQVRGQAGVTTVISAPTRAEGRAPGKSWGVFAPLYGLRSARSGATGDLHTMQALRRWVAARGGAYVGTLPLLAQFLEDSYNISPYAPASRLFWNELYLETVPPAGLGGPERTELAAVAASSAAERARLAELPQVAYREQARWKRAWIDAVAKRCVASDSVRAEIEQWAKTVLVFDYAMFRAFGEREGQSWHAWGQRIGAVAIASSVEDAAAAGADPWRVWSHVVAQWMMHEQLTAARRDERHAAGLYLDLPVGVSGDAYEVWRHRELFVTGASAGAPPDALFLGGQEWGLPPLHPAVSRATGHAYFRACLRHHMQAASMLRIDHVMGLHRLYCVPRGMKASLGAYLRYPKEELYALITLESRRARCAVVGEDLGTVPDDVPPALARHDLGRLWVSQFVVPSEVGRAPAESPRPVVASFGTHDMATFAGWWRASDIADRRALGLIDDEERARQEAHRGKEREAILAFVDASGLTSGLTSGLASGLTSGHTSDEERAMAGLTLDLARGPSEVVLVTLEDLWLEPAPQNVPGTLHERPNWLRPLSRSAAELGIEGEAGVEGEAGGAVASPLALLDEVAALRRSPSRD